MNDIDILNQKLKSDYSSFQEVFNLPEALEVCIKNPKLYKYIYYFNENTWTNDNQKLFSDILEEYNKSYHFSKFKITNPSLLTHAYQLDLASLYRNATNESLNEENIKLAYENNKVDFLLFRNNSLALKIYLNNNYNFQFEFTDSAWNSENARIYIKKVNEGSLKNKIFSFYTSLICFKEVINEHQFQFINNFYTNDFKLDDKIGNLLCQKMIEHPDSIVPIKMCILKEIESYYLKGLLLAKRIDLVDSALTEKSLNEENFLLLADNLEEYLNSVNDKISFYLFKSSIIVHKLIEIKKYDIISYYIYNGNWTEENIKFYYEQNLKDSYYHIFVYNPKALEIYCLKDYKYKINFAKECWTKENIEYYFAYLKRVKPSNIIPTFIYIPNFFNSCLKHNVFNYFKFSYDENINYDLLCEKLREFPNEEFNFHNTLLKGHPELVLTFIETKRYYIFESCLIDCNQIIIEKFCSIMDEYFQLGFKYVPSAIENSPLFIKRAIELKHYDKLSSLSHGWTIENATLLANKYVTDDNLYFYDLSRCNSKYLIYALKNLNVYLPSNSKYTSNCIDYHNYKDSFFTYLTENKINDVYNLIDYFKQENVIEEYISNGYLTDKFKKILIFNHGYQCYCQEKGIDIFATINDLSLISYLKCAYKVPNLYHGIFINETNYNYYFDENGPKQELYDDLFNVNSLSIFKALIDKYPNEKDKLKIYFADKFSNIENKKIITSCLNYFKKNYKIMTEKKVDDLLNLIYRIDYSNALEIHQFSEQIISNILTCANPLDKLNKIEKIFLKDDIPMFAKVYQCFKTLYPQFQKYDNHKMVFDFSDNSRISPELLKADPNSIRMQLFKEIVNNDKTKIRFQLIFNDLLRCSLNSKNESLMQYLNNLKKGNDYMFKLYNHNFDSDILTSEELKILNKFVSYLTVIYENINNQSINHLELADKCQSLIAYYKPNSRYSLADRVVRSFGFFASIDSLEQIFDLINCSHQKAKLENEYLGSYLENHNFELHDDDLLRCIGKFDNLGSSLENGNVCKELLGSFIGKSDSDTTPMDVDFSLIKSSASIYNCIDGTPTGWNFGNIFLILKDYYVTRDKNGNLLESTYDPMKVEVFGTSTKKGGHETHWGGRSGFAKTNIKCILYKKMAKINSNKPYNEDGSVNYEENASFDDLPSIKFEIVRNGLYIPIVDLSGKLIFTINEYNYLRSKMMGLSKYGCPEYHLDTNSLYFDGIDELVMEMVNDRKRISNIRKYIYKRITEIIMDSKYNLGIQKIDNSFQGDLTSGIAELLEIGSTARFSNIPFDSDFDFMLKLDRKIMIDKEKTKKIIEIFEKEFKPYKTVPTKSNRFRGTGISISEFDNLDIDISIDKRRNNDSYSSEKALNDIYNSIKKQYPDDYPYVLANIVKAKQLLKNANIYKRVDNGLGGIGVENWILQNGGSLKNACQDFIIHAYKADGTLKSFAEFKSSYYIFDFGCNHEPREKIKNIYYSYDNYMADNLNEYTYKKMANILQEYIDKINFENKNRI